MSVRRAAFIDRDGVINVDRAYVHRREEFEFVSGVFEAARELRRLGFVLVVVTNQSGIGRGIYTEAEFDALTEWMKQRFAAEGAPIDAVYFCPHHPFDALDAYRLVCDCRKPAPGMLLAAVRDLCLDLRSSVMFGNSASDLQAAQAAGVEHRFLLGTDGKCWPDTTLLPAGLHSASFRSLLDAVLSPELQTLARANSNVAVEGT
jgi:D-glycero-D-manno-heptose 1,7-bisphosphate phosphatase